MCPKFGHPVQSLDIYFVLQWKKFANSDLTVNFETVSGFEFYLFYFIFYLLCSTSTAARNSVLCGLIYSELRAGCSNLGHANLQYDERMN